MRNGLCAQLAGLVVWRGALVSRNLQKRFAIVLGFDIYIYPFPFFIPYCMAFPLNLEVFVFAKMQAMLFDSPIGGIAWA